MLAEAAETSSAAKVLVVKVNVLSVLVANAQYSNNVCHQHFCCRILAVMVSLQDQLGCYY